MSTTWEPYYNVGQEEFFCMALTAPPTGADGESVVTPTGLALVGYGNNIGDNRNPNATPIRSIGSRRQLGMVNGREEPVITGSVILSASSALAGFLKCGMGDTPSSGDGSISGGSRYKCLPVINVAYGTVGACGSSQSRTFVGYKCMVNTMTINIAEGQSPTAQFELWPLAILDGLTPTLPAMTDSDIVTAGGYAFTFQHLNFAYSGQSAYLLTPGLSAVSIEINNNLRRRLTRLDSGDLARCARVITPGDQVIKTTLTLADVMPETRLIGNATASLALDDGTTTSTLSIISTANYVTNRAKQGTDTNADTNYTAELSGSGLTVAYASTSDEE